MSSFSQQQIPASHNAIGFTYLVIAIFSYGGMWPVMRVSVPYVPAFWFATIRVFIGALILFAILAASGRLRMPSRADLPAIFTVGVLMMGLYVALVHYALQFVPAGRAALLSYSTPIWVTPVAVLFFGEKLTKLRLAGLICGIGGLGILFNPSAFDWTDPDVLLGNGLCVLAAISWSAAILLLRGHEWHLTPLQLGPWQLLVGTAVALPCALFLEPRSDIDVGLPLIALIAYGGIVGSAVAMWSGVSSIRHLGPVTSSVGLLGGPVVAITTSVLFLDEALTLSLGSGLVLILSGIAMVSLAQARPGR